MLAEHAKTVHPMFVDYIKYLRYGLSNFLLKLIHDFENIIISKDSIHPYNNLSHD